MVFPAGVFELEVMVDVSVPSCVVSEAFDPREEIWESSAIVPVEVMVEVSVPSCVVSEAFDPREEIWESSAVLPVVSEEMELSICLMPGA